MRGGPSAYGRDIQFSRPTIGCRPAGVLRQWPALRPPCAHRVRRDLQALGDLPPTPAPAPAPPASRRRTPPFGPRRCPSRHSPCLLGVSRALRGWGRAIIAFPSRWRAPPVSFHQPSPPPPAPLSPPPSPSDVLERPYTAGGGGVPPPPLDPPPPPPPPLPMFEADSQHFASAPSVPRGFKLQNFGPAFGGDHRGTLGRGGVPAKPPLQPPPPPSSKVAGSGCGWCQLRGGARGLAGLRSVWLAALSKGWGAPRQGGRGGLGTRHLHRRVQRSQGRAPPRHAEGRGCGVPAGRPMAKRAGHKHRQTTGWPFEAILVWRGWSACDPVVENEAVLQEHDVTFLFLFFSLRTARGLSVAGPTAADTQPTAVGR